MTLSLHCRTCSVTKGCGRYHLYVVELDLELTKNKKFMGKNPFYKNGMDCLYVGSSSHTCVCRFRQHRAHAKKEEDGYVCLCRGKEDFRLFVRSGGHTRGSYYPGIYGLRLRPDLYSKYNPIIDQEYAAVMEVKLAVMLRTKGYAVWQH